MKNTLTLTSDHLFIAFISAISLIGFFWIAVPGFFVQYDAASQILWIAALIGIIPLAVGFIKAIQGRKSAVWYTIGGLMLFVAALYLIVYLEVKGTI